LLTNKENCALKVVDEIILYYDARSKKHQNILKLLEDTEQSHDNSHVGQLPVRDLNYIPPDYKSRQLLLNESVGNTV